MRDREEAALEIERKYRLTSLPQNFTTYPHYDIEQGYLCSDPVVRVRRSGPLTDGKEVLREGHCSLVYKSSGLLAHEEETFSLTEEAYQHLKAKADGIVIQKTRYRIPFDPYVIELDLFHNVSDPRDPGKLLCMAEVEFPSLEEANAFQPADWFGEDVTMDPRYHNSAMVQGSGENTQNHK